MSIVPPGCGTIPHLQYHNTQSLPRSTFPPAKCLRRPANHAPKYPNIQFSRSELQNTKKQLEKERPTWHDASLFLNQHAKRVRVLDKISNKHRMVLRLLRWVGSSCVAWDRAENARMYRGTTTPHCGLGSYPPPEHQPLFERILAIPAPVSQVQVARSEKPHHTLTSIVLVLTIDTSVGLHSFEFPSFTVHGHGDLMNPTKKQRAIKTNTNTVHETSQHLRPTWPAQQRHACGCYLWSLGEGQCAPPRVRVLFSVCNCACVNECPPLSYVKLIHVQSTVVYTNIQTSANLFHLLPKATSSIFRASWAAQTELDQSMNALRNLRCLIQAEARRQKRRVSKRS